eukprot:CAMPEP_0206475778 /NCGR_PEP_ID=MMETSP0324_2-20121206/34296_1 /ASSEMBLY_ACC=CAM_ASM_000836 /TAXON_ID=2866 /ORGANISM="Crypthecodinium cohnii, Strain Seligo" /LENGTH=148 /DNA_ID=CAMNT_0053951229 /DNA_START=56 /DNA_END=502 /DNA_ORIENTATION=-
MMAAALPLSQLAAPLCRSSLSAAGTPALAAALRRSGLLAMVTASPWLSTPVLSSQQQLPGLMQAPAWQEGSIVERSEAAASPTSAAGAAAEAAAEVFGSFLDLLRPRKFAIRLDTRMKRGAAPYPRNPARKKPVPKVKGIVRRMLDEE